MGRPNITKDSILGDYENNKIQTDNIDDLELHSVGTEMIAFRCPSTGLKVRFNEWGEDVEKHLNSLEGTAKKDRLDAKQFNEELRQTFLKYGIVGGYSD